MRRYARPHRGQRKTSPLLVVRRMITEKNESLEPRSRNAESQSGLRMMMNLDGLPNGNENSTMSRSWKICPRRMVSPLRPCIHNSLFSHTRTARKARLDMQIEAILKPKKVNKSKKKRKDDEEVLDRFADEEVSRLRESMLAAAADDDQANRDKSPATSKLKLLPQVMEVLRKCVQRHIY